MLMRGDTNEFTSCYWCIDDFLLLQSSFGGFYASGVSSNSSGVVDNNITILGNTTTNLGNNASLNLVNVTNTTSSNYEVYTMNCPKWDDYKNKHPSPITNFVDYRDDLQIFVKNFISTDDYNIQQSKANYENKSGYFSGNPTVSDLDYRYMTTSELNKAYNSASFAKSRILIPNSLSTSLQATYTMAAVVLGAASGICTTVAGVVTATSAVTLSHVLIVCIAVTSIIVATTIAIGNCTGIIATSSSDINVEPSKIDSRMTIMTQN
jgi:hypothetical protein